MSIPLACADFTFPLLEHDQSLALIAMLGVQGVDIGLFENRSHLQPSDQFDDPTARGAALRERLQGHGLRCADVFLQCDTDFTKYAINHVAADRRAHARRLFEQTIAYAQACGAEHITTLPGVADEQDPDGAWGRCCEELAWRVAACAEAGIAFGAEAHVGSIAPDPETALRLVQDVPGLKLTLDYTHFTRDGRADADVEPLIQHANHFHLRGACPGRLQASMEQNTIDYARVVERMLASDYPGYIGIEYVWTEWERCNEVDNLCETIRWRDFVWERLAAAAPA